MNKPLVAVWMLTYNHEKFISQAIEGVINQQANFIYKIYLGEDCSTDNTRNICVEFAKKFPEKINLFLNEKNDINKNASTIFNACFNSGAKYIAMCEGDDYWTDPNKLQKQINLLENDERINACFHNVKIVDENDLEIEYVYQPNRKEEIDLADLGDGDYMKTCSLVFRNLPKIFEPLLERQIPTKDTSLGYCLLFDGKKAKYFNEVMAVYRRHDGGVVGKASYEKKLLYHLPSLKSYKKFYHDNILKPRLIKQFKMQNRDLLSISIRKFKVIQTIRCLYDLFF